MKINNLINSITSTIVTLFAVSNVYADVKLEEVIVTAQKREQSLQKTPIAISVLTAKQMQLNGTTSFDLLRNGSIPSLNIIPLGSTTSTLITSIRGNGPTNSYQVTRDGSVAIYQNGVYQGRAQGLSSEMLNIDRIEVLRGPQGTLFGRNAVGGAVNIISKKPTGEFGGRQLLSVGNYDAFRSITHVDLPEVASIKASIDYVHTERDGWVNNTAPGQPDYNEYNKDGGRINLLWQAFDNLSIDYAYDRSDIESTQMYFQRYNSPAGIINIEPNRQTTTRFPIETLEPTTVDKNAHSLIVTWQLNEIEIKSLTSYGELDEKTSSNFAGALGNNGLIFDDDIEQEQFSQELQISGQSNRLDWVAGLYYFTENTDQNSLFLFSLDADFNQITPPTDFGLPRTFVDATADSQAIYGQITWTPPAQVLNERLQLTIGARYTEDEKSGNRFQFVRQSFELDNENFDTTFIVDYQWLDNVSTYIKRSTAYKAGGSSILTETSFIPFDEETVETWEIGLKSELWDQRLRVNAAAFWGDYDDLQIDVTDPIAPAIAETINAADTIEVDGFELDIDAAVTETLRIGLSYTYLNGDQTLQPNPLAGGAIEKFVTAQTPQHAGALTVDYTFPPWEIGTLSAHLNVTSTDRYSYVPYLPALQRFDSYTLTNARITLSEISTGYSDHSLSIAVWGKNITDEEYIIFAFPSGQAFGTPRTAGIDIMYQF